MTALSDLVPYASIQLHRLETSQDRRRMQIVSAGMETKVIRRKSNLSVYLVIKTKTLDHPYRFIVYTYPASIKLGFRINVTVDRLLSRLSFR